MRGVKCCGTLPPRHAIVGLLDSWQLQLRAADLCTAGLSRETPPHPPKDFYAFDHCQGRQ